MRARIVVVPTVPLNVRRVFETHNNKSSVLLGRPPCTCTDATYRFWAQAGLVHLFDGHFCLRPVSIDHQGSALRGTDPLPYTRQKSRRAAIASLSTLASATPSGLFALLPLPSFPLA